MPNRILKESICTSDSIAKLSWFEEVLFYRLIVSCDDYGRYDARPAVLKGKLFPLSDVTTKQIEKAIIRLSTVAMVKLYEVYGRPFLQLCAWANHQTIRAKKSKYPAPEENADAAGSGTQTNDGEEETKNLQADENICMQMQANESKCSRNPIQTYSKSNTKTNAIRAHAREAGVSAPCPPPLVCLILKDGTEYEVTSEAAQEWSAAYQAIDCMEELRKMVAWCKANPDKRKTRNGIQRFINNWLNRANSEAKAAAAQTSPPKSRYEGIVL